MSEYIIDTEKINELKRGNVTSWLSPYAISDTSVFPPRIKETHFAVTLPEIVRCRDCECYHRFTTYAGTPLDYGECMKHRRQTYDSRFCAWAEGKGI